MSVTFLLLRRSAKQTFHPQKIGHVITAWHAFGPQVMPHIYMPHTAIFSRKTKSQHRKQCVTQTLPWPQTHRIYYIPNSKYNCQDLMFQYSQHYLILTQECKMISFLGRLNLCLFSNLLHFTTAPNYHILIPSLHIFSPKAFQILFQCSQGTYLIL